MKYTLLVIGLYFTTAANAQNLLPNPGFTISSACPDEISGVSRNECLYWRTPNPATPDYFHTCATSSNVRVPSNIFGSQASATGAYTGIYTFKADYEYREYLQTDIPALQKGHQYRVTLYVSLADQFSFASDGIGVFFYQNAEPYPYGVSTMPFTPQIDFSPSGAITDKTNWTKLSATFIADSAYTHLLIGNFKEDAATDTVLMGAFVYNGAYYYIDSASVEKDDPSGIDAPVQNHLALVTLSPNPITDKLTFRLQDEQAKEWNLQIFNISGNVIYAAQCHEAEITIAQSDLKLAPGHYYYRASYLGQTYSAPFSIH